jgi:RluA family pseudouridine synthase
MAARTAAARAGPPTTTASALAAAPDAPELPPIPTLLVVADEFTLMLADHPEYADLFDYVARKGRSFRIHILFASQTLDVGKIKDIDKNTSYRIGLKVASPGVSRQIIGVDDAFHIESGREHKGEGFLVPAPGAAPIKFRSTYVDGIYEPPRRAKSAVLQVIPEPRLFPAGWVEPDAATVIISGGDDEPAHVSRKLIATIGAQLAGYGPRAPRLWLPPLDEPIPLAAVLDRAGVPVHQGRWPLGEIDKPAGLVVHPAAGHETGTLVNALIAHCGESLSGIGGVKRPGIVHRLDKDTSGLLVVAKTDEAHQGLSALFADHGRTLSLTREYLAFVWGQPERSAGMIDAPLGRHPWHREKQAVVSGAKGREAITHYKVERSFGRDVNGRALVSLVRCSLETGRTHQIRVHMAHIGHPVLGDPLYAQGFRTKTAHLVEPARALVEGLRRQALHATSLGFEHPVTGEEMMFENPLSGILATLAEVLP